MNSPLVTVICLCYNQSRFVEAAILSVLNQTYSTIQLIVMDDYSDDGSQEKIKEVIAHKPNFTFISNKKNLGNCKAFNEALKYAEGKYIIDLAGDDVLLPNRVEEGVLAFKKVNNEYGINFSDAEIINDKGEHIRYHYERKKSGQLITNVPEGNVFESILRFYFICPPTIMVKKQLYDELGGYDESLNYEDFDFWVRSSRTWKYCYTDKVLVKKREVANSLGKKQYKRKSIQMRSTYIVCKKANKLCVNGNEFKALRFRIRYELKYALWFLNFKLAYDYFILWTKSIQQ